MLIYLAYISIFLRIVPTILQWKASTRNHLGARYFFLLCLISVIADLLGILCHYTKTNTDFVFNAYQIGELVLVSLLVIEIGKFKSTGRAVVLFFCSIQILIFITLTSLDKEVVLQDFMGGISKLYVLIVLFISALNFIRNVGSEHHINVTPLIGLLGIFIFESLSIIPNISMHLQRLFHNPQKITTIYLVFLISGNVIRDVLLSYHAIRCIKNSPR